MSKEVIVSSVLGVVDNHYPDRSYKINVSVPEFTCVCPKTGQPDFANIEIDILSKYVNKYFNEK